MFRTHSGVSDALKGNAICFIVGSMLIAIGLSLAVTLLGLGDLLFKLPLSVLLAIGCIIGGIFILFFSPGIIVFAIGIFFAAFPGKIFVEPFSFVYYIRGIWLPLFTPLDIFLLVIGTYGFLRILTHTKGRRLELHSGILILIIYLAVLIIAGLINFFEIEPLLLAYTLISVFRIIVLFITIKAFVKDERHVNAFLFAVLVGMVIQSSYSLFGISFQFSEFQYSGRLGAPGLSVNSLGALIALYMPVLISNIASSTTNRKRFLLLLFLIVFLIAGILSFSRAGLVGLVFGCGLCLILLRGSKNIKILKVVIPMLIILIIFLVSQLDLSATSRLYKMSFREENIINRFNLWRDTMSTVFEQPLSFLLGRGIFGNRLALGCNCPSYYDHAHNIFLQVLLEGGIVCLTLYGYMVINIFKSLINIAKLKNEFTGKGLLCGLSGFFLASMFDYTLWEQKVFLLFWSTLIVSIRYIEINKRKATEKTRKLHVLGRVAH